jgi:hypothetical protein
MNNQIDEMDLLGLYNCSISTKYGMADKGNPKCLKRMESQGLVKESNGGYVITELGLLTIKVNKPKLFGMKKKEKKPKKRNDDSFEENSYSE